MKFYNYEPNGSILEVVKGADMLNELCGGKMKELIPGTSDGAAEKHVPVVTKNGNKIIVEVGSIEHPMVDVHYIEWIAIETKMGSQKILLSPADKPRAEFYLCDGDEFVEAYEYCNIHGLWSGK